MRSLGKIRKLLKIAQEGSIEIWQQVKEEAESEELPPELDVASIQESAKVAEDLGEKAEAAKKSAESLTDEEKSTLKEASSEPGFLEKVMSSGNIEASASFVIDTLFVKAASKKIGRKRATAIIRDINIYSSLHGSNLKIASRNSIELALIRKKEAFDKMLSDEIFLKNASPEYLMIKKSDFMSGLKGLAEGISGAVGSIGSGIKTVLSGVWGFIWKVFPIITLFSSIKDGYNSYSMVQESLKKIVSNFSDLGSEESLLDPKHISGLIEEFKNIPETLLRVTKLNKIAMFYKQHWYNIWFSVASAVEDIISIVLLFFSGGISAVVARVAGIIGIILGFGSLFGSLATSFFDLGVGDYIENSKTISGIAGEHISEIGDSVAPESEEGAAPADSSNEEALRTFRLLQDTMSAGKAVI